MKHHQPWRVIVCTPTPLAWFLFILGLLILLLAPVIAPATDPAGVLYRHDGGAVGSALAATDASRRAAFE